MLERIIIENYRCYNHHEIEFKNLTIIVGKNNAGKSTMVEALRLVSLALSRFRNVNYINPPIWLELPQKAKGISPSLKSYGFNIENLFHNYGTPPSIITAYFENSIKVKIYIGENAELFCVLMNEKNEYIVSKSLVNSLKLPQVNILPELTSLQKEEKILNKDYVRQNLSTDLASNHFRNQLSLFYENFPRFIQLSESSWNGLRIRDLENRNALPGSNQKLSLLVQDGAFVSEIGWMGSGLQMWLQIMWFLSRVNENEVIILDEPDVYMHPDLQRRLIRLLKDQYKFVIVSTHSIEIISEVEPSNILVIDKQKEKSSFANRLPVVQNILNSIGSIHNLQLTKLWSSNKLIIVEGEDISILKRLHNKLYPNSIESFDSVPNFDIGGWGGWNNAKGSNMLLKETIDYDIKVYCIFDSDYHTPEEITEREKEAQRVGVNIHIWKKKEIENYLINSQTIFRIIKKEGINIPDNLTVAEIEKVIEIKTNDMKEEVIDRIADCIQKRDRNLSISTSRKNAVTKIDKLLDRICGKDLISSLSRWSQENYKVSLSPIKLAINIQPDEIDYELRKVIRSIEECKNFEES